MNKPESETVSNQPELGEKTDSAQNDPEYVMPVEQEDRVYPEKLKDDAAEEAIECVVPDQKANRHGHNSYHKGKTKSLTSEEVEAAEKGFIFRSLKESDKRRRRHRRHHHRKGWHRLPKWLRIVIIVLCVLLAIAIALVATFFILREIGRSSMHNYDNIDIVPPTTQATDDEPISISDSGRKIVYNGTTYTFNENVVCFAVIGVDKDVDNDVVQSMGDAIMLVAFDTESGQLSLIGVSRDTMTSIDLYSSEGRYIDTETMQITYAYSLGTKDVSGGKNTASSLSKLFFGLPVNHYFAINLDALVDLNNAIGGVTLTSSIEFYSQIYHRYVEPGETVTLYDYDVQRYVRSRDIEELDSNSTRMQHQQEYVRAFLSQVIPAVKKDLTLVTDLYNIVSSNSDSNIDLPKIVYLASELASKMDSVSEISYRTISGETVAGEKHAEFYADDANILETMLDVFYLPEK